MPDDRTPIDRPPKKRAKKEQAAPREKRADGPCETCLYYDVLDESGEMGCTVDIDEDEAYRERADSRRACPYYHFYDEYKLVRKQN